MANNTISNVAIIGLGNQAKSWALNWRDSGLDVGIYLRAGSCSFTWAQEHEFACHELSHIAQCKAPVLALLIPDHEHLPLLEQLEKWGLPAGKTIIYGHGLSMHRHQLAQRFPQWQHWLLAPKAIASELRHQYLKHGALAAFTCVANSSDEFQSTRDLNALAHQLGINCGPYHCSFSQEALADMFSEQAVLCSTLPYVAKYAFELLEKKGMPRELAFYECFYEMKLIVDTMLKVGPEAFFQLISPNALIGGERATNILFDDRFHAALDKLWSDLESGQCLQEIDRELNHLSKLRVRVSQAWSGSIADEFKRFREANHVEAKH